jgi:hypothetical protein
MVTAKVTYSRDDLVEIETSTGHKLQFGGMDGDGFCYSHQSFDCLGSLTAEEQAAVDAA